MQIHLTLKCEEPFTVPLNYNYQLQSAVYSKLSEIGASDFWHNVGFGDNKQKLKSFVFGPLTGTHIVENKKITFTDEIHFELRSPIFEFCDELQRSFEINPIIKLFDTSLEVCGAALVNRHINNNRAIFKSLSPIVIHSTLPDKRTVFHSPDEGIFIQRLQTNYQNKFQSLYNCEAPEISLKISENSQKIVTNYKGTWITGYKCRITAEGHFAALEFLYNSGLGEKNSQGFGMVDIW